MTRPLAVSIRKRLAKLVRSVDFRLTVMTLRALGVPADLIRMVVHSARVAR